MALLRNQGQKLKSTLLTSLASKIAADPFAKIKKLIQELIERLLQEAANEANQKGWCDKATADATQKRSYAADEIEDLNAKMAKLAALSDKLKEEIKTLNAEINELTDKRAEAEAARKEESAENANTVTEAKAEVDLSLAQGPLDDAPDAGFDNGEAYKGAGAEAGFDNGEAYKGAG